MKKKQFMFAILSIFVMTTSILAFATPMENSDITKNISTANNDNTPPQSVKIIGIWGYIDDRTPDGYFRGEITRKGRFAVFRGVFNETDNETRTPVIGIMKNGYFIGKVITDDGPYRVTGLYRIDREKHLLKLRWMAAREQGWAVGRVKL